MAVVSSCRKTAGDKPEEGEDDVKSSCPLCPGRHTCYNGRDKGSRSREVELTPKPVLSSDCRLQLACMKPESLVIAAETSHPHPFLPMQFPAYAASCLTAPTCLLTALAAASFLATGLLACG
ncbi:hypothetical protein M5K25_028358 [Dendrobium thyrsiflorum]|uniref:Uncharacterized protein n=1 Tax=Dendrobium thyrsiflorum TaxID=117978 RepID=A0ABD0TTG7_DENTH